MTGMAHEAPRIADRSGAKLAAWSVLVTMGGTSVTLNIYDATHSTHPLFWVIAGLRGFAPVFAAMGLSEAAARFDGGKTFRCVAFAIMTGAMLLSASAVANVLRPSYPAGWVGMTMSWVFGIVLDAAALTGLWIILTERERRREAALRTEADDATQAKAEAVAATEARMAREAQAERTRLEAEAAEIRTALEADMAAARDAAQTELVRVSTELAAANATAEALRSKPVPGRKRARSSARKPAASGTRNQPGTTAPELALTTGPEGELDMDQEARLLILDYVAKGHSASEAGRLAGKTDGYGRQVVRLANAAKQEPAGDDRAEGDMTQEGDLR